MGDGEEEESVRSLKERNGRIGAFPPRGYSTFMTRQRDRKEGEEQKSACFCYACVCVYHSHYIKIGTSL